MHAPFPFSLSLSRSLRTRGGRASWNLSAATNGELHRHTCQRTALSLQVALRRQRRSFAWLSPDQAGEVGFRGTPGVLLSVGFRNSMCSRRDSGREEEREREGED